MEAIIIAVVTSMNFIIIKWKIEHKRYEDAALDSIVLFILASLFSGSLGGLIIATITSFIVSIYLLASPPKFLKSEETKDFLVEFKKRMPKR